MVRPFLCNSNCYNATLALKTKLTSQAYSRNIIPSSSSETPLVLSILFALVKINSLDNTGVLSVTGLLATQWIDERISWNPENYNSLIYYQASQDSVWTPTLTLLNPASSIVSFPLAQQVLWIQPNGSVFSVVDYQFVTACSVNLTLFPYDTQTCYMEFTDLNYWSVLLTYQPSFTNVSLGFYNPSSEWDIVQTNVMNSSKVLPAGSNVVYQYQILRVTLQLQRKWFYYTISMVLPTILLEVLMLFVFLLPRGSVLKVTLSASLMLTMYVLQRDTAQKFPSFDDKKYPRIISGLTAGLVLGAVTVVVGVLSVTICQLGVKPPNWLRRRVGQAPQNEETTEQPSPSVDLVEHNEIGGPPTQKFDYVQELAKIKLQKHEECKRKQKAEKLRKLDDEVWCRVELAINVLSATGFLVACIYFILSCFIPTTY